MALSILFPPVIEAVRFWNQFYWLPLPRVLIDQVKGEGVLPADSSPMWLVYHPAPPDVENSHGSAGVSLIMSVSPLISSPPTKTLQSPKSAKPSLPKAFGQFPTVVYSLALSGATDAVSSVGAK